MIIKGNKLIKVTEKDIDSNGILRIPDNVEIICRGAMRCLDNLKEVIGKNVKEIGYYNFSNCKNLTTINLPNVKGISNYNLYKCPNIKTIYKMNSIVIEVLDLEHGKKVLEFFKSRGIDTKKYNGFCNKKERNITRYYGIIDGTFRNYSLFTVIHNNAKIITLPERFFTYRVTFKKIIKYKL